MSQKNTRLPATSKKKTLSTAIFVDRLEEVLDKENLQLVEQSGEDCVVKRSKKRRRCTGEFSGRQLAFKKLEKEGDGAVYGLLLSWQPSKK